MKLQVIALMKKLMFTVVIASLLTACASRPSPDAPFFEESVNIHMDWFYIFGGGEKALKFEQFQPVVEDDVVYAAFANGQIFAKSIPERKTLWILDLEERLISGLTKVGNVFYVCNDKGELMAVTEAGEELWRSQLTTVTLAPVAVSDKAVFVHVQDGKMLALDKSTGQQLWQFDSGIPRLTVKGVSAPRIDNELVYAGFANGKVVALSQVDGSVKWEHRISEGTGRNDLDRLVDVDGAINLIDGLAIASAANGKVIFVDLQTGRRLGEFPYGSVKTALALPKHFVMVLDDDSVVAIDPQSQEEIWRQERFLGRSLSHPVLFQGKIMVTDYQGYLYGLDVETGKPLSVNRPDHKGVQPQMIATEKHLFVQTLTGRLKSYSVRSSLK